MTDPNPMPDFLRVAPGTRRMPRSRRPAKLVAVRPEGLKWEYAERWEVTVDEVNCPGVASGTRCLWVIPGRTWTEVRDSEAYCRLATKDWERMANKGRQILVG